MIRQWLTFFGGKPCIRDGSPKLLMDSDEMRRVFARIFVVVTWWNLDCVTADVLPRERGAQLRVRKASDEPYETEFWKEGTLGVTGLSTSFR